MNEAMVSTLPSLRVDWREGTMGNQNANAAVSREIYDEQIDIFRIRLLNPHRGIALLGELRTADRILENWRTLPGCSPVEFQVTFLDGFVLEGRVEITQKEKRKSILSRHIKRLLCDETDCSANTTVNRQDRSRYSVCT